MAPLDTLSHRIPSINKSNRNINKSNNKNKILISNII